MDLAERRSSGADLSLGLKPASKKSHHDSSRKSSSSSNFEKGTSSSDSSSGSTSSNSTRYSMNSLNFNGEFPDNCTIMLRNLVHAVGDTIDTDIDVINLGEAKAKMNSRARQSEVKMAWQPDPSVDKTSNASKLAAITKANYDLGYL